MVDFLSRAERSERMSRIAARHTVPEIVVRRFLHSHGFRYRLHSKRLPGHPDIVLPKYRTVIFVNGCFWHHHEGCKIANVPQSNIRFWMEKFERNRRRDRRVRNELRRLGWHVMTVWECQIVTADKSAKALTTLVRHMGRFRAK